MNETLKKHYSFDLLSLFSIFVALYGMINFFYLPFGGVPAYTTLAAAFILLAFPEKPLSLFLFALASVFEYVVHAPLMSNHLFIGMVLWSSIIVSWSVCALKQHHWDIEPEKFYRMFAPIGRWALLTMYFFGVFHKINADFLNPDVSCATTLLHYFIFIPHDFEYPRYAYYAASYGTLIIESIIAFLLLFPKTRYWAVVAGVAFHLLISLSMYRYYIPFTMLSIVMHALFMDAGFLERMRSGRWAKIAALRQSIAGRIIFIVPVLVAWSVYAGLFDTNNLQPALTLSSVFAILIMIAVIIYDKPDKMQPSVPDKGLLVSPLKILNIVPLLFFLSCFSPYVGFKTAHTINMFSNLNTEGSTSNHYVFKEPIPLFDYQQDLVRILDTDDEGLESFIHPDLAMVGFHFESYLLANPDAYVRYERQGEEYEIHGITAEQKQEFEKSNWLRYVLLFHSVNTAKPRTCLEPKDVYRMRYFPERVRWFELYENLGDST